MKYRLALPVLAGVAIVLGAFLLRSGDGGSPKALHSTLDGTVKASTVDASATDLPMMQGAVSDRAAAPRGETTLGSEETSRRVHVLDEAGKPLAGIEVSLDFEDSAAKVKASTDAKGICRFDLKDGSSLQARVCRIDIQAQDGFLRSEQEFPPGISAMEITLIRASRMWGRVRYSNGDIPNEGAYLRATLEPATGAPDWAGVDVIEGQYDFGFEIGGRVTRMELESPGQALAQLEYNSEVLEPGADRQHDFVFDVGPTLELSFLNAATQTRIEGVQVLGLERDLERSNDRGVLLLVNAIHPDKVQRLRGVHPDFASQQFDVEAAQCGQTVRKTVELEQALELAGIVVDMRAVPQPNLLVSCEQRAGLATGSGMTTMLFQTQTTTDSKGYFRLPGIPPRGSFQVVFARGMASGVPRQILGCESVTMPAATQRDRWLIPDAVTILCTVLDWQGAPVPDLAVSAQSALAGTVLSARTDSSGCLRLPGVLPGRWILTAAHGASTVFLEGNPPIQQRSALEFEVAATGDTVVEFRLSAARVPWPKRELSLRIVDAATGEELHSADWLTWTGVDSGFGWYCAGLESTFKSTHLALPIGFYQVSVGKLGYTTGSQVLELVSGEGSQSFELSLVPAH